MSLQKDAQSKHQVKKLFTATGAIAGSAAEPLNVKAENQVRVVVEGVGGGNTVLVLGRIEGQTSYATLETINGATSGVTVDVSLVDEVYYSCTAYAASGTPRLVASGFFEKASSGGGGGAVNSASNQGAGGVGLFDSLVGDDLQFKNLNAGSSKVTITDDPGNKEVDIDVDPSQISISDLADGGTFNNNTMVGVDNSGIVGSIPGFGVFTNSGGMNLGLTYQPDNLGGVNLHQMTWELDPTVNSPNDSFSLLFLNAALDPNSSGFQIGTNGNALTLFNLNFNHQGTGDVGTLSFINTNSTLGNGTDPIDVKGISGMLMFANVSANVNINGSIQGFIFQPGLNAAATIDPTINVVAFGDNANFPVAVPGHVSFQAGPTMASVNNNNNYTGVNLNPSITTLTGNAQFQGLAVAGSIGTINAAGGLFGVNVAPTVTNNKGDVYGVNVTLGNVTNYAGVKSTLTEQDLTFDAGAVGTAYDAVTIEYTAGGTAGSEVVTVVGLAISVQIDSGVSTATQIKAALDASVQANGIIDTTISGTGSNPQTVFGPTNLAGGEDAGLKKAAYFGGDVEITGNLTFGGALSIGELTAIYNEALVDSGGATASGHMLITGPSVAASTTLANADYIGVNTAALINIGASSTVTTAFLGVAALGLPAVLTMGASSTLDRVAGAVFALSLDAAAGGGTVDQVYLCRALAIPNGSTTVNRLYGYEFSLPFGTVGTDAWGVYLAPDVNNWMKGSLRLGGTTLTDDKVDTGFKFHVEGDSKLEGDLAHFTGNIGFFGTTPVVQQAGGAATAGGTYGATEQTMLQAAYDALRAYGLLT